MNLLDPTYALYWNARRPWSPVTYRIATLLAGALSADDLSLEVSIGMEDVLSLGPLVMARKPGDLEAPCEELSATSVTTTSATGWTSYMLMSSLGFVPTQGRIEGKFMREALPFVEATGLAGRPELARAVAGQKSMRAMQLCELLVVRSAGEATEMSRSEAADLLSVPSGEDVLPVYQMAAQQIFDSGALSVEVTAPTRDTILLHVLSGRRGEEGGAKRGD